MNVVSDWSRTSRNIFVHVPKVAGRSIQAAIGEEGMLPHCPALAYRDIDPELFDDAFKFCFARNPWDRLVSAFHFILGRHTPYNLRVRSQDLHGISDFDGFLRRLRTPLFRHRILSRMHFMPQHHFFCDLSGTVIVDFVGRYERLADDLAHVSERIGIDIQLPHVNANASRGKAEQYFDADWKVDLVGKMYAKDVELLGYDHARVRTA